MDTETDWTRELDTTIAHGPDRPTGVYVAAGRRAVRRRRALRGLTGLAAAVVVGGIAWAATPGASPDRGAGVEVADRGSPSQEPTPTDYWTAPPVPAPDWSTVEGIFERSPITLARFGLDGGALEIAPGVRVVEEVPDAFRRSGVEAWAAVVDYEGRTYWILTHRNDENGSYSADTTPLEGSSISDWLREYEVLNTSYPAVRRAVTLRPDGTLSPSPGVRVVRQQSPADADQAPAGLPSATATVEVDGARLCLIVRTKGSSTEQLALPESEYPNCADLGGWHHPGMPTP